MYWLTAYPIATISSAAFYLFLILLAFPTSRALLAPYFVHPIPPHQEYLRGFDSIRGFAACFVAIAHCWWASYPVFASSQLAAPLLAYGTKGVPIFAVLSGFLIYRSALSIESMQDFREYAVRRFFRIYPVYLFTVILCVCFGQYVGNQNFSSLGYFVADALMFNVIGWSGGFANPPAWSLYIEVAFYAFMPIAMIAIGKQRMLAFAALGLCAMILADFPSRIFVLWRYFLIGIIASELSPYIKRWALPAFAAGLLLFAIDLRGLEGDWVAKLGVGRLHRDYSSIGLGLACGLILMALPHLQRTANALNVLPLRIIGVVSYSIYLIQFFYILANFPLIERFIRAGTSDVHAQLKTLPMAPSWYLPLIFFPGVITWGAICFLLVERPGIKFGQRLLLKSKTLRADDRGTSNVVTPGAHSDR